MPVTGHDRKRNTTDFSLGPVNTTSFLFDDDEDPTPLQSKSTATSPPNRKTFMQLQETADGFPKLISREYSDLAASAALDLALARGVEPQPQVTDRATGSRHRISLPPTALSSNVNIAPLNSILANADSKSTANNRRSMEVKFSAETKRPSLMASPPHGVGANGMQKPLSSYSTSDIPTLKNVNGEAAGPTTINSPPGQASTAGSTTSDRTSAILSRNNSVSTNANRQSKEFSSSFKPHESGDAFNSFSGLHANAPPFGPMANGQDGPMPNFGSLMSPYAQQPYSGAYNVNMLNNGFGNMNLAGGYMPQGPWLNQMNMFGQQGAYGGYQQFPQNGHSVAGAGRLQDTQRVSAEQRRQAQEAAQVKYASVHVNDLVGEIYGLCKDQHGCRFLQRKLDERDEQSVQTIFNEVKSHIIELMTDPFGNYLCQKLLESTNDEQRTVLIRSAMPAMSKIALNQHGTRALQKMIEFISTPEQTNLIIDALRYDVVQLIQDLNGNHVIQKCLNHLSPEDAQFIFDAVGANCIVVGTHRHGCCVLQRCIDHAPGLQKGKLVDQVINDAFSLVQDPFGNYVVQYILDLGEPRFTEPLCKSFESNVSFLSKQKFSSNVVEKCIRCCSQETRRFLVAEIMVPAELEKVLRDSYANYVIQTAMDYADPETRSLLMEQIRPLLPAIRSTPHGRRIQTKLAEYDQRNNTAPALGTATPAEMSVPPPNGANNSIYASPQSPPSGRGNRSGWIGPSPQYNGNSTFVNGNLLNGAYGNGTPTTNGAGAYANGAVAYANGTGAYPNGTGAYPNGSSAYMPNNYINTQHSNSEIISPTPQRHSQGNNFFAAEAKFGGPDFAPKAPTFGKF